MKEYMPTIVSTVISTAFSVVAGWVSVKLTYNTEIKKTIYEKRQDFYVELFALFEQLQQEPELVYNSIKFIQPLRHIKAETNLYASREVLNITIPFYQEIMAVWKNYIELYESEKALKELSNRQTIDKECGISPEETEWRFIQEAESYMAENLISDERINEFLNMLATQIRTELKTE